MKKTAQLARGPRGFCLVAICFSLCFSLGVGCGDDSGSQFTVANSNRNWNGQWSGDWTAPQGIPEPPFCVQETVDGICAGCTVLTDPDLDTLEDLAPGTVVELTGGPYTGSTLRIGGAGTATAPIFVRSVAPDEPAIISRPTEISGSYVVVEHLDFDLADGAEGVRLEGHHLCLRHSQVHGMNPGHNSTAVYIRDSTDVALWNNFIHDNGDFTYVGEQDVHGVGATSSHRLWIVDNLMFRNRGDSVQFGHQADNTLGDIYIGRNELHSDGENCVDIKEASNVIISQNLLHHPAPDMPAVVLHDCPVNAAVLDNEIFDADAGVSMASLEDRCDDKVPIALFVLDNRFHDITGDAVQGWNSGKIYYVSGNTFTAVDTSISIDNADPASLISKGAEHHAEACAAFATAYGWSGCP